jgi:hypothetical protein
MINNLLVMKKSLYKETSFLENIVDDYKNLF